jgi:hypothetical protein
MIVCAGCGLPNEDGSRFCGRCGRPFPGVVTPAPVASAPTVPSSGLAPPRSVNPSRFRRAVLHPNPRHLLAIFLLVAFVLGLVCLGTGWWYFSAPAGAGSVTDNFLPGSNYNVMCSGSNAHSCVAGSPPYTVIAGPLGSMYVTVLALAAFSVALTGLAALFAGLAALGRNLGGWQRPGTLLLSGLGAVTLLGTLLWVVGAQPGMIPSGSLIPGASATAPSPSGSFWGANTAANATWGAGLGWYFGLASVIFLLIVVVLLLVVGRHRLATPERRPRPVQSAPPVSFRSYTPPPPATVASRSGAVRPSPTATQGTIPQTGTRVTPPPPTSPVTPPPVPPESEEPVSMLPCPNCGTENLAKSRTCCYCQRSLRES